MNSLLTLIVDNLIAGDLAHAHSLVELMSGHIWQSGFQVKNDLRI